MIKPTIPNNIIQDKTRPAVVLKCAVSATGMPGYVLGIVDNKIAVLFDSVRDVIPACNAHCEQPHNIGVAEKKTGSCKCATDFSS